MEKLRFEGWSSDDPIKMELRDGKWWATWDAVDYPNDNPGEWYTSAHSDGNWQLTEQDIERMKAYEPWEHEMSWETCWLCKGEGGYWNAEHTRWIECEECNSYGKYLVGGMDRLLVRSA